MLLISELLPKVQELQASRHKGSSISAIVDFLSTVTLKHVLPETPAATPRRFLVSVPPIRSLHSNLTPEAVVQRFSCLVDIPYMGRDICSWDDTFRHLECHQR